MTKQELRKIARERLSSLTATDLAEKSAAIRKRIRENRAWQEASTVCLYATHGAEPDLDPLSHDIAAQGKRICYPRVEGPALEFFAVTNPADLAVSKWKLREPARSPAGCVPLSEIDLVLIPGLAFSSDGSRLGRGGGFYDRLLANSLLKARRIGICFEAQIIQGIPLEEHDQRVDEVLTERS